MLYHVIFLISITSTTSFWKQLINQCPSCINSHNVKLLSMAYKPITYRKVDIMANTPLQILVNDKENSIINEVKSWKSYDTTEEQRVNEWIERGLAFWSSSDGVQSIHSHEQRLKPFIKASRRFKPQVAADMYVNRGTESDPIYISAKYMHMFPNHVDLSSISKDDMMKFIENGIVYTNATKLFKSEELMHRAEDIAVRLKDNFPITSEEWKRWTNKTTQYNATSLTQVFAEYYSEQSIGDIGGDEVDYVPKPGHIGTLPPGVKFQELNGFDELSKKVLHPWPAMQQIPFHCRWPPSHPMIPPPLLWIGLNNMYTENFTATQMNQPFDQQIVGGVLMEPKDAMRIAKYGKFGLSYVPEHQIKHGGMIFDAAYKIPHYNPDHPPTNPDPVPPYSEDLHSLVQRWIDPYYGLDVVPSKLILEANEIEDADREVEERKKMFDSMVSSGHLHSLPAVSNGDVVNDDDASSSSSSKPLWLVEEEEDKQWMEGEIDRLVTDDKIEYDRQMAEVEVWLGKDSDVSLLGGHEQEKVSKMKDTLFLNLNLNIKTVSLNEEYVESAALDIEAKRQKFREELQQAQVLTEVSRGVVRNKRALIKYTIESMEDLIKEYYEIMQDAVAKNKRSGRRKSRRKDSSSVTGLDGDDDGIGVEAAIGGDGLGGGNMSGGFDGDLGGGGGGGGSDY